MINAQAMAVRNGRAMRKQKYIAIAASKVRNPNVTHLLAWRLCDCGSIRSPFSPSAIRESSGLCFSLHALVICPGNVDLHIGSDRPLLPDMLPAFQRLNGNS